MKRFLFLFGFLFLSSMVVLAQQADAPEEDEVLEDEDVVLEGEPEEEEEDGFLLGFIQDLLSAPGREVRISGVSGILSSEATIDAIRVSDGDGVWLEIEDVVIDWSRSALFLRRIDISSLQIGRIAYLRPPLPPEPQAPRLEDVEAQPFTLPELPLAVRVAELGIEEIAIGEPVFGQAATLTTEGHLTLEGGELDTELAVRRLDEPGGLLSLDASFSNETRELAIDLGLSEPQGGVVATLLDIENRPAVEVSLEGAGPLEDLDVSFSLEAGGERLAAGEVALREAEEGLAFGANFAGELAPLVPPDYRDFFAGRSAVRVSGLNKAEGGLRLDEVAISADALTLEGSLETGPDGFLRSLELAGDIGGPENGPVTLPVPGGDTTLDSGTLNVSFGEGDRWEGAFALDGLVSGDLSVDRVVLDLGGIAENLEDPATRNVTITAEGLATGLSSEDPSVDAALGERVEFAADVALPPGEPVAVRELRLAGSGLSVSTSGTVEDLVYDGRYAIAADDLAPFSGLAGRDLAGAVDLQATGEIFLASGGFDLVLDGSAEDLEVGIAQLDPLLRGETTIAGRLRRNEEGLLTDDLRIANAQIAFTSSGTVSGEDTDIAFEARVEDLGLVLPEATGAVTAEGRAAGGGEEPIAVVLEASMPEGSLLGREVAGLTFGFRGEVAEGDVTGALTGDGRLNGSEVSLQGQVSAVDERRALEDLHFTVGPNVIAGNLVQEGEAAIEGVLEVNAPDLGPLAALGLVEAQGEAEATVRLGPADVGQGVSVEAAVADLVVEGNRIGALDLQAEIEDAFGVPLADATLAAEDIVAGGLQVASLQARAEHADPDSMDFSADARLSIGTELSLAGALERLEDGFAVTLEQLLVQQQEAVARLEDPATIRISGGDIALSPLALEVGEGRVEAEGVVGEALDLELAIDDLALSIANTIMPELGLGGTVNGDIRVTGSPDAPQIAFDVAATEVTAAAMQAAALPPLTLDAEGRTDGSTLNVDASLSAEAGLAADVSGAVPLGETGELDLAVDLRALPLALVEPLAGVQGLQGSVTGTAEITGTLADPAAQFDLSGSGLSAAVLRENAIPPLSASAEGSFAGNVLTLGDLTVTGPGALSATASGTAPLEGPIDLSASGTLPLSLANVALAERTTQLSGLARFDLAIGGSLTDPQVSGPVTVEGGTLVDPQTNIRLENITLDAALEGQMLAIENLTARSAQGGTARVSGTVGIDPEAGLPADLGIAVRNLVYTDGSFFTTRISGDLSLTGAILGDGALLAGEIVVDETEVSVAEGFGGGGAGVLQAVQHRNVPPPVQATLDRARLDEPVTAEAQANGPNLDLNVLVRAPNRIFIRGRGLDAEVGGELLVQGPVTDVQPVGQFDLIRGRLNILGQRIEFDEGRLQLVGNLDPVIFFQARTEVGQAVAIVTVSGRVSEPDIAFSSIPDLPEDEVLALILFNRATGELSPFQIAQLAAAAAELAGAGGNGLLSQIRGAAGLDELDIVTTEEGDAAVRAGRYIDENIYLDVQTGTGGNTRVSVNLDITEGITARGTVGSDGNSTLGIYYEQDY